MSAIAIITARGGSKRIPKKNVKDFCGKPIIAYSIEAALSSDIFDEIMVSTDDEDIAKHYGAKVPFFRSAKNSDDFASTADVLLEVLCEYEKLGKMFDVMTCIYPTAPFITAEKLKDAKQKLEESAADAVVPVVAFSYPPQRAFVVKNGLIEYQHKEFINSRSQDLETVYHDCGQFYVCKVESFKKCNSVVGEKTVPLIIPETEVQDIDNITDWEIAEMKYRILNKT